MEDNPWHHASPDAAISEQTNEMIAAMQLILWFKRDRSYNNQRFGLYKRKKKHKHTNSLKSAQHFVKIIILYIHLPNGMVKIMVAAKVKENKK